MTTPLHGNFSESNKQEVGFEASGLSPEEADRLAASFKPSWEFDEAPFAQGHGGLDAAQIDALAAGGVNGEVLDNLEARTVPPHSPPARVETHEPEVSVIIDRSITAAEMEAAPRPVSSRPPAPVASPFAAPVFAAPAFAPAHAPARVAPVMRNARPNADESIEIPASLTKSNKGLFIGLGVAVAAAVLVFVVHGAMSDASDTPPASTAAAAVTTAPTAESAQRAAIPPVPAAPPPTTAAAPTPPPPAVASPPPAAPAPARAAAPAPRAQPRPPPPAHHAAAPRNPPKAPGGGIVRDVPF